MGNNYVPVLGLKNCALSVGNTGVEGCNIDLSKIEGILLVPKGTIITYLQATTLKTTVEAMLKNDNPLLRAYPMKNFMNIEPMGSDAQIKEGGFGNKYLGKNATVGFKATYLKGAMTLHKQLSTFTNNTNL